jgi:Potential Queuosine, Q, salvage protein family
MEQNYSGFRDISSYKGEIVYFLKRAQILASDLFGSAAWQFNDLHELTMFPDYQVPQVLNSKGVMVYSLELQNLVDNMIEIPKDSEYEIEIRAATVVACDEIAKTLNVPAFKVDWLIWQIGEKEKKLGLLKNHHRTITTFY